MIILKARQLLLGDKKMFPGLPDDNQDKRITAERFSEFRQNIDSQNNFAFEERRNDLNRSKNVFIGAVSGVVLAGIVGWFVLSPRYAQNDTAEIPVIRRPQAAVKVQPSDPGGMEILNQDKTVYNIIDKTSGGEKPSVEKLLPPPEEPQIPVVSAAAPATGTTAAADTATEIKKSEVKAAEEIKETAPSQVLISQAQEIIKTEEKKNAAPAQPVKEPAPAAEQEKKIVNLPSIAATEPQPAAPAVAESGKIPAGQWTVQLMSSPNQKAVQSSWTNLSKKHAFLAPLPHEVEAADLGTKGTYYRLYAGAFADRTGADSLCGQIKNAGGSCIVKKK